MEKVLEEILNKIKLNQSKGSKSYYQPLSKIESEIVREYYQNNLTINVSGNATTRFFTLSGTHISTGYKRVVIGDYGAYIEFSPEQINQELLENKFAGTPTRTLKYIWLVCKDGSRTKIYKQVNRVSYADYQVGMFYIHPSELYTDDNDFLYI